MGWLCKVITSSGLEALNIILLFTFFEQPYKAYCILLPHIKFMFIKSCLCLVFLINPGIVEMKLESSHGRHGRPRISGVWAVPWSKWSPQRPHQWCDRNCCSSTVASWNLGGMMGVSQLWLYYGFLRLKKRAQRCMDSGSRNRDHLKNEIGNV